jgi:hypothetical protein
VSTIKIGKKFEKKACIKTRLCYITNNTGAQHMAKMWGRKIAEVKRDGAVIGIIYKHDEGYNCAAVRVDMKLDALRFDATLEECFAYVQSAVKGTLELKITARKV